MDDPLQWICIMNRLPSSDRVNLVLALPETHEVPGLGRDRVVNAALVKHGLNHLVDLDAQDVEVHAAAWRNHEILRRLVRRAQSRDQPLDHLVAAALEYAPTADALQLIVDQARPSELRLTRVVLNAISEMTSPRELELLRDHFGYTIHTDPRDVDGPVRVETLLSHDPVLLRVLGDLTVPQTVELLLTPRYARGDQAFRYELLRGLMQATTLPDEVVEASRSDPRLAALITTVERELEQELVS